MEITDGVVRPASPGDAADCVAIYRPYVTGTAITFEVEVPTVDEMAALTPVFCSGYQVLAV